MSLKPASQFVFTIIFCLLLTNEWSTLNAQCIPCGDGSDSLLIVTQNTTLPAAEYNYTHVFVGSGVTLNFSGDSVPIIRATGSVVILGNINVRGGNGGNATTFLQAGVGGTSVAGGQPGGSGGYTAFGGNPVNGFNGKGSGPGMGGSNYKGASGAGHAAAGDTATGVAGGIAYGNAILQPYEGGSGGGGGAGGNGCGGGGGGGGGGVLIISACDSVVIMQTGSINANGGNGGTDGGGNCGGGGGGSGGSIWLSGNVVLNAGAVSAEGGNGGGASFPGESGGAGADGRIRVNATSHVKTGTYSPAPGHDSGWMTASDGSMPVACFGDNTGMAWVTVTGGIAPIDVMWGGGQQGDSITGIGAGSYTYSVTDSSGCYIDDSVMVEGPTAALMLNLTSMDPNCFGDSSGYISAVSAGGWSSHSISWSTGDTTDSIGGLGGGIYIATVTDSMGCTASASDTLVEPAQIVLSVSSMMESCAGCNDGIAICGVTGGVGPYTYSWNTNPVQTTDTATGLAGGSYTVTVTDSSGCTAMDSTTVTVSLDATKLLGQIQVYPNPARDRIQIDVQTDRPYTCQVLDLSGKMLAEMVNPAEMDLGSLAPGSYLLRISAENHSITKKLVIQR